MKIWPIITLGALIWGSTFSDGQNVGRESNPHPRRHIIELDLDPPLDMPHRVATMAYREFFAKLLADEHDWSTPEAKATAEATDADADDGEDPGKKKFWRTVVNPLDPVPFTGWGDPNPIIIPDQVAPTPCSSCRPTVTVFTDDPGPPSVEENAAAVAETHAALSQLPFGALQALNDLVVTTIGSVTSVSETPCATALIDGLCPVPCSALTASAPACSDRHDPGGDITQPLGGLPTGPTDPSGPILAGGGGGSGVGGGGVAVGSAPEPSTWIELGIGFGLIAFLGWRKRVRLAA